MSKRLQYVGPAILLFSVVFFPFTPAWGAKPKTVTEEDMKALKKTGEAMEAYRKVWNDPGVVERINKGIECNRKGDVTLEFVFEDGRPVMNADLEIQQKSHKFLFGCNALVLGQLGKLNEKYEYMFTKVFNFATIPFFWEGTEPEQGKLRYEDTGIGRGDMWRRPAPDRFIPFAKKYGLTLKGHPLLFRNCNPKWLPKDPEELRKLYEKRFREIAERYAKDVKIWDVANETLQSTKSNFALHTPDRAYVAWAFKEAASVFQPDNMLMINENPDPLPKVGYYEQIKHLLDSGVDVRGIGLQHHYWYSEEMKYNFVTAHAFKEATPTALFEAYEKLVSLGLPLYITEITVPINVENGEAIQAEVLGNLYRLWFSTPGMAGITYWNLADGTTLGIVDGTNIQMENKGIHEMKGEPMYGYRLAGLLDKRLEPKEAYRVLDKLINHDWKTRMIMKTGEQGKVQFRGFFGKYAVKVVTGNLVKEFEFNLSEGGQAHKLVLKL